MNNQTNSQTTSALPQNTNYQSQIKFIEFVIDNMKSGANKRIMITGDTGLGKTSFVTQFSRMLGFPSIVIEIPHVVEENLINIPFVIFDKQGHSSQGYDVVEKKGTQLVLGTSHLASSLLKLKKMSNDEYAKAVKSFDPYMKGLVEAYEQENPGEITAVRNQYERILFFDEYYRQTTTSIRNILRNVLNGRIGNDPIPQGTYVMYASNLTDVGGSIDPQSQHTSFFHKEYKAPSVKQWLTYTLSKALGGNIKIKQDVLQAFQQYLTDERLSYTDINTEIRSSPRRWSEILLYINNAYPFKSPYELSILVTTLKRQFQGENLRTSEAYQSLETIINYLAQKSNISVDNIKPVSASQWRDVLAQQVMTAISVGEQKKYVPVIQGLPGVGKTAIGAIFEQPPYNLRFIPILSTTIDRESIPGTPLPDQGKTNVGVEFSAPELYMRIMNMIEQSKKDYIEELQEKQANGELQGKSARAVYTDWERQRYKYMIFFDEINRVSNVAIFNSLRRLILERKFNDQYKLPKESIVVAAMNPNDMGTQPLTSHFRDAIDLIDVAPSWKDTIAYLKNQVAPFVKKRSEVSDTAIEAAIDLIEEFPKSFSTRKMGREHNEFYINAGGVTEIYISPRDYDNLFKELAVGIDRAIKRIRLASTRNQAMDKEQSNEIVVNAAAEKFQSTLDERFYQAGIDPAPGFYSAIEKMILEKVDIIFTKKTEAQTLGQMFQDVINDITNLADDMDFTIYMDNYRPNVYTKGFKEFLMDQYENVSTSEDLIDVTKNLAKVISQLTKFVEDGNYMQDIFDRTYDCISDLIHNQMLRTDSKGAPLFSVNDSIQFMKIISPVIKELKNR